MDFQSLFIQINELEETNRQERCRLSDEQTLHANTKKELEKGTVIKWVTPSNSEIANAQLAILRDENLKFKDKIIEQQISLDSSEKVNSQLKKAVKEAKEGESVSCCWFFLTEINRKCYVEAIYR